MSGAIHSSMGSCPRCLLPTSDVYMGCVPVLQPETHPQSSGFVVSSQPHVLQISESLVLWIRIQNACAVSPLLCLALSGCSALTCGVEPLPWDHTMMMAPASFYCNRGHINPPSDSAANGTQSYLGWWEGGGGLWVNKKFVSLQLASNFRTHLMDFICPGGIPRGACGELMRQ